MCYRLVGVINHCDLGQDVGHYTCHFHDHGQKQWFYANDEKVLMMPNTDLCACIYIILYKVRPVNISKVLQQDPFLLVYELCGKYFGNTQ